VASHTTPISRRQFLASAPSAGAAVGSASALISPQIATAGEGSSERVHRLARELSIALAEHQQGSCFATVYPSDQIDPVVSFRSIEATMEAAYGVSPVLMQAICDHAIAYFELAELTREADLVRVGGPPSVERLQAINAVERRERDLLMAICRFPASNDHERQDKAGYLLGFLDGDELSAEHVREILSSMLAEGDASLRPISSGRHRVRAGQVRHD
jgi:hypothetical protein